MTWQDQLDMAHALELDYEHEREQQIRELAITAAEAPPENIAYYAYAPPIPAPPWAWTDALISPTRINPNIISVNLHPALRGFTRVLVAEEIIRKQLGDK